MLGSKRRAFGHGLDDAADTGAVMKKVLTNFRHVGTRDDLADVEVGHSGLYGRAVLGGRSDIFGELCRHTAAASWTKFTCSFIFGDLQLGGREVENLAFFFGSDGLGAQINTAIWAGLKGNVQGRANLG